MLQLKECHASGLVKEYEYAGRFAYEEPVSYSHGPSLVGFQLEMRDSDVACGGPGWEYLDGLQALHVLPRVWYDFVVWALETSSGHGTG